MSESFRNLRHLTQHVKEQKRIYTELDEAIASVSALLDSVPERERHVKALEEQAAAWEQKLADFEASQKNILESARKQRAETQALMQQEQQQRVTAREAFKVEQQQWHVAMVRFREEESALNRAIEQKRQELDSLSRELESAVKAALRR